MTDHSRAEDWRFIAFSLVVVYFVLYPLYVLSIRFRRTHRIKRQIVTTLYKVPLQLSPAEFSYLFSTRIKKPQLYATLLDLSNQGIVLLRKRDGEIVAELGAHLSEELRKYELMLLKQIYNAGGKATMTALASGQSSYGVKDGRIINGTKLYIFLWLLRSGLQQNGIIQQRPVTRYVRIVLVYGVLLSLLLSMLFLLSLRSLQMLDGGNINLNLLRYNAVSALLFWSMLLPPMLLASFFVMRFHGRMLGRVWLFSAKSRRYLLQMEAFREFVRLTHKDRLRFANDDLKKEAIKATKPYAVALGYVKLP